jgi:histidyl-tRNA synthetase
MGIPFSINPNIVRGLDYYTRTVFEFVSDQIGAQGTVCGGGRYDGLVSELGGQPMPALGFAGGVERLLLVMEAQGVRIPEEDGCDLFVAVAGEEAMLPVQRLVQELRFAGVSVERDLMGRALKAQMKYASRIRARYCVVVGEEEIQNQKVMLKDMQTGEQVPIELNAQAIRAKLPKV